MSINIGPVSLASPVVLAPMSGITDMPFRRTVKRLGVGLVVSEMIASQAMIRQSRQSAKMAENCPEEAPMAVQLAGCEPDVMAEAARLNADLGAAIIDINMGCPAKKVVNGYAGSALMRDESHAAKILEAVVRAVRLPVTLKMRLGWDDANRNAPTLARIAESCGIKSLAIHGRTRCQFYEGRADWQFIRRIKDVVKIPVFGNGDVNTVDDAAAMLAASGADGVMIGRGAYGRPWFLAQVAEFLSSGRRLPDPSEAERMDILLNHYEDMLHHYGTETGMRTARKHIGWYSKGLPGAAEFRATVNHLSDPVAVRAAIRAAFTGVETAAAA